MDIQIEIEFSRDGLGSALGAAITYMGVRTLARMVNAVLPTSAVVSLIGAVLWLAAALWLFFVITWQRDDNWLAAGIIIGLSLLCGGLVADFVTGLVTTASITQTVMGTASAAVGLLLRTLVLIPLSGGCVLGARWLTRELSQA